MNKVFITGNQRLSRGYAVVVSSIGALILVGNIYSYVAEKTIGDGYATLFLAVVALAGGLPLAIGWKKPDLPEIHLSNEQMDWKRNGRDNSSFRWENLDRVDLNGNTLKITYARTGSSDTMKIPYLTDVETMLAIEKGIREMCEKHDVTFDKN
ncbi:MAG: hypothetical protein ACNA78_05325 [Balneolaceae bacterium]